MKTKIIPKILMNTILSLFGILCIVPLVAIISVSLSNENDIIKNGYNLFPRIFDTAAYSYVLYKPTQILNAYKMSLYVIVLGTFLSLAVVSGISYTLSRIDFKFNKILSFYVFITLLFNGGLVPLYIWVSNYLHLKDTIWVLILPYMAFPWFILLLRTFMRTIPMEIIESCKIDGASEFTTFFKIILPLSKPGLATIALFTLLQYWNDWWLSLLFIEKEKLVPLQFMLYRMMNNIEYLTSSSNSMPPSMQNFQLPSESARMAMGVLVIVPMLLVFPFFQKYFVKGLTVGAVKG